MARRSAVWGITWVLVLTACGGGGKTTQPPAPTDDPAGTVVALDGSASAVRATAGAMARQLAVKATVFADDTITTAPQASLKILLTHNQVTWSLEGGQERRVDQSLAWKASPGSTSTDLLANGADEHTAAAGRHTENEAMATVATGVAPPPSSVQTQAQTTPATDVPPPAGTDRDAARARAEAETRAAAAAQAAAARDEARAQAQLEAMQRQQAAAHHKALPPPPPPDVQPVEPAAENKPSATREPGSVPDTNLPKAAQRGRRAPSQPTARLRKTDVGATGLSVESVAAVGRAHLAEVQSCFENDPLMSEGDVVLAIAVADGGKVVHASMESGSALDMIGACMSDRAGTWTFDAGAKAGTLHLHYDFRSTP